MKKGNYIYGILLMFFTSCLFPTGKVSSPLLKADSLIEVGYADSALELLENINFAELSTLQSRAKYALLLTQAKDKNYIPHTDDSLIRLAVEYYDASSDTELQAKAHYYWGRVCQDKGDIEKTVHEFLIAIPLAEKINDYDLSILLKNNLGLLLWQHGLQEEADSLYQQAAELAEAHQDSVRLAIALVNRADICMERGEKYYINAEEYLKQARELTKNTDNQHVKNLVYSSLCFLWEYQGKSKDVILYAKKGLECVTDTLGRMGYYLIQGSAYAHLERYDSAIFYLNKCLVSENYYTKASAYMKLSEVAKILGKKEEELKYETLYSDYKDSMKLVEQPVVVVSSLKNELYRQATERYESFLTRYRCYLLFLGIALILILSFFLKKHKKKRKEMVQLMNKRQSLYKDIIFLKDKLEKKEIERATLQQHCEQLKSDASQKEQLDINLQELLHQCHEIQESLEQKLNERNEEIKRWRSLNLKIALASSPIYKMLIELCEYNNQNPDGMKEITNEEWRKLLQEIDILSLGFVERLKNKYECLLEEDIRFCGLVMLEFKYSEIASIWGCTPVAVHKRSKSILKRMKLDETSKIKLLSVLNKV